MYLSDPEKEIPTYNIELMHNYERALQFTRQLSRMHCQRIIVEPGDPQMVMTCGQCMTCGARSFLSRLGRLES
jgi:hypothetical protein